MTDTSSSFNTFLKEFQATLSEKDNQAMLRRINAERLLHLLAEYMADSLPAARFRFLADNHMAGAQGADFLLQIDDYDLRIELLDAPEGKPELPVETLAQHRRILEDNPNTVALILVWAASGLPSVPLSVARIRYLQEHEGSLARLLEGAQSLESLLSELVQQQTKTWDLPLAPPERIDDESIGLRDAFSASFASELDALIQRPYRIPARKEAAKNFPFSVEKRTMLKVLDAAMNGESSRKLVDRLTEIGH